MVQATSIKLLEPLVMRTTQYIHMIRKRTWTIRVNTATFLLISYTFSEHEHIPAHLAVQIRPNCILVLLQLKPRSSFGTFRRTGHPIFEWNTHYIQTDLQRKWLANGNILYHNEHLICKLHFSCKLNCWRINYNYY